MVIGNVTGTDVLVRVHSECLTGDALGSVRCDCGPQLRAAQAAVAAEGCGVILYLRGHEGRGIGLIAKLEAYALQDQGADTLDANLALGLPADARDYAVAADILRDLQVGSVRLLSNNPRKWRALRSHGVTVSDVLPLVVEASTCPEANRYLATKRDRMGHRLPPSTVATVRSSIDALVIPRDRDGVGTRLEPVIEISTDMGRVRIGAAGRGSWHQVGDQWCPLSREPIVSVMGDRASSGRLLLIEHGKPTAVVETLAPLPDGLAVTDLMAWLGWPYPTEQGELPDTIAERLGGRSNDYWVLELILSRLSVQELPPLPGITIVIPARDVHTTIADTVGSVVQAAGRLPEETPWECLVVDDVSTPPLSDVVPEHPRVRVIRATERVYCGGARNFGIHQARYPVVVFVDGDTVLAPNYLLEHAIRHLVMPNLITVSLREQLPAEQPIPDRRPDGSRDTRVQATYQPGRLGLVPVTEPITVRALEETNQFRDFGYARHLGPVDLPFMVKGTNFAVPVEVAKEVGFPPDFVGYGTEDGTFAAKAIARGAFVVPVLNTGVFHREHPPRSGSLTARDAELRANLFRQARHLQSPADEPWINPSNNTEDGEAR